MVAGCVCPQTGQVHPLPHPPPLGLFPPLLKVLIRSALTRFTVCLPAGKQAHSSFARTFTTSASSLGFECGCVCPQTGQVCSYSLILLCIVSCGVFGSVPLGRASLAGWMSLFWLAIACALLVVWFSFLGAAGLLSFVAAVRWCWCGGRLLFCLPWWLGCLRFGPLPPGFPLPSPLVFFWCILAQSVSAGPSLRISGCICNGPVVIPLAWRVVADWLLSSLRFVATKASALCGASPSPPCCGCCSCAPRCGTEVFALG